MKRETTGGEPLPLPLSASRDLDVNQSIRQIAHRAFMEVGDTVITDYTSWQAPIAPANRAEKWWNPSRPEYGFQSFICPHRGAEDENTMEAIERAVSGNPHFVEFDVQLWDDKLHLGHPPVINKQQTLEDVLPLFDGYETWPKIDLKLDGIHDEQMLDVLIQALPSRKGASLINIGGEGSPDSYMNAERRLLESTPSTTLLNIDLERYANKSREQIDEHIRRLARPPHSISPNLAKNFSADLALARRHHITHVHFWACNEASYAASSLSGLFIKLTAIGFEIYFDIATKNINYDA